MRKEGSILSGFSMMCSLMLVCKMSCRYLSGLQSRVKYWFQNRGSINLCRSNRKPEFLPPHTCVTKSVINTCQPRWWQATSALKGGKKDSHNSCYQKAGTCSNNLLPHSLWERWPSDMSLHYLLVRLHAYRQTLYYRFFFLPAEQWMGHIQIIWGTYRVTLFHNTLRVSMDSSGPQESRFDIFELNGTPKSPRVP